MLQPIQLFASANNCSGSFFGIPHWYQYLPSSDFNNNCQITNFTLLGPQSGFIYVALALIEILLFLAGMIAVGYVIYGGIQYVASQGEADKTSSAKQTIENALVGMVIAMTAIAIVSFIGNALG